MLARLPTLTPRRHHTDSWLLSTAFPGAAIEQRATLEARASSGMTLMFERVVIVDRWSAHAVPGETARWGKVRGGRARGRAGV